MKYRCLEEKCGKVFMHPDKKSVTKTIKIPVYGTTSVYTDEFEAIETHVCPYCQSLNFDEHTPPQPEITSIKSVPIEDADSLIVQGYVVLEAFAKTVTLVKKKEEKP